MIGIFLFSEVLKGILNFGLQDQCFYFKLLKLMIIFVCWLVIINIFLRGMWVFCSKRKHLLAVLLSLEFIVLRLYLILFIYLNIFSYELFFRMVFLTFSVCEGALGLSILVSIIRTHGNDFFQSFIVLQC